MNLQQLPKYKEDLGVSIREVFVAEPGYKYISADYSGQELRILAEVTKDEKLIEAFKSGRDFHQETANQFSVSRTQAKAINFGVAYGKGSYGFSKDFNISEEEAQKILDNYFNTFTEVKKSIEETKKELDKFGFVKNLYGRRRRMGKTTINDWTGHLRKDYRQAFNFKIQGAAADMIRIAAIKCRQLIINNPEWDLKMIATVHDEINFTAKEEHINEVVKGIKNCFETAVDFCVPIIADVKYGNNYSETK